VFDPLSLFSAPFSHSVLYHFLTFLSFFQIAVFRHVSRFFLDVLARRLYYYTTVSSFCQHLFSPFFHFGSFVAFSPFYGFLLGILYMLSFCFRSPVLFFGGGFFFLTVSGLGFSFCSASSSPPPPAPSPMGRGITTGTPSPYPWEVGGCAPLPPDWDWGYTWGTPSPCPWEVGGCAPLPPDCDWRYTWGTSSSWVWSAVGGVWGFAPLPPDWDWGGDWGLRCTARPLCFTSFSISPPRGESPPFAELSLCVRF